MQAACHIPSLLQQALQGVNECLQAQRDCTQLEQQAAEAAHAAQRADVKHHSLLEQHRHLQRQLAGTGAARQAAIETAGILLYMYSQYFNKPCKVLMSACRRDCSQLQQQAAEAAHAAQRADAKHHALLEQHRQLQRQLAETDAARQAAIDELGSMQQALQRSQTAHQGALLEVEQLQTRCQALEQTATEARRQAARAQEALQVGKSIHASSKGKVLWTLQHTCMEPAQHACLPLQKGCPGASCMHSASQR